MKVGDKVKVIIKHNSICHSNGCGESGCVFSGQEGIIQRIMGDNIHVTGFKISGIGFYCSGFGVSDLELVTINWRKRMQSDAVSR